MYAELEENSWRATLIDEDKQTHQVVRSKRHIASREDCEREARALAEKYISAPINENTVGTRVNSSALGKFSFADDDPGVDPSITENPVSDLPLKILRRRHSFQW